VEEVDARAVLGVSANASREEIEAAYSTRVRDVRKQFEKARDHRTREKCRREREAIDEARRILLPEQEQEESPQGEGDKPQGDEQHRPGEEQRPVQDEQQQRPDEQQRVEGEERRQEELRRPEEEQRQREEEQKRIEEERRHQEQLRRIEEEEQQQGEEEQKRIQEEEHLHKEQLSRIEEEQRKREEEQKRIEEEERRHQEQLRRIEEEEQRKRQEDQKRVQEEERRHQEQLRRIQDEQRRRQEEQKRIQEEQRRRLQEQKRIEEEERRRQENVRRIEEEQRRRLEEQKRQDEERGRQQRKRRIAALLAIGAFVLILAALSAGVWFWTDWGNKHKPGKLVLNTVPAKAEVFVDGVARGTTPLVLGDLVPGERHLRIQLKGYQEEQLVVVIEPGGQRYFPLVTLVRNKESAVNVAPAPTSPAETLSPAPIAPVVSPAPSSSVTPAPTSPAVTPIPTSPSSVGMPGERFPQTRLRILTEADVANLDYADLQYAINEMYARHSAQFFREPDLRKQFEQFTWYFPMSGMTLTRIDREFSRIEQQNRDLLARVRDQKRPK
jgi:YARHG domain/PEGA domain